MRTLTRRAKIFRGRSEHASPAPIFVLVTSPAAGPGSGSSRETAAMGTGRRSARTVSRAIASAGLAPGSQATRAPGGCAVADAARRHWLGRHRHAVHNIKRLESTRPSARCCAQDHWRLEPDRARRRVGRRHGRTCHSDGPRVTRGCGSERVEHGDPKRLGASPTSDQQGGVPRLPSMATTCCGRERSATWSAGLRGVGSRRSFTVASSHLESRDLVGRRGESGSTRRTQTVGDFARSGSGRSS